jgi:peptide subunit release factor 1 (eRF1)
MELHGTKLPGVVRSDQLARLTQLAGPVLSIYLDLERNVENAAYRDDTRWRTLRRTLTDNGVPESILSAIDPLIPDAHLGGACVAIIANAHGVQWVEHGPQRLSRDRWSWEPIAHIVPIIEWRQRAIPYVMVTTDRTGADLLGVSPGQDDVHEQVDGETEPIRKVAPGGWSQRRFQQRAENNWEQNANDVAREVMHLVERTNARAVLAGGDVRAMQLLRDALPSEHRQMLIEIAATRAADGSGAHATASIEQALETIIGHDSAEVLRKYAEEAGQNDRAAEGIDETVGALQRAQVDALLLMESAVPPRTAWFGPEPTQIATKQNSLETFAVENPTEAPIVDVLVRAALGTDAGVRVVPFSSVLAEGVGALLRWR